MMLLWPHAQACFSPLALPPGGPHLLSYQADISSIRSGPGRANPSDHTIWSSLADPGGVSHCSCLHGHEKGITFVVFVALFCISYMFCMNLLLCKQKKNPKVLGYEVEARTQGSGSLGEDASLALSLSLG